MANLNPDSIKICFDPDPDWEPKPRSTRMAAARARCWTPGATLRVRFLDGAPELRERIAACAAIWCEYANIQLDFGDDPDAEIRITCFTLGFWSKVGTEALEVPRLRPTLGLGGLLPTSEESVLRRAVLHEFGHALGCIHEHQNPSGNIPWNREAVYQVYEKQGWSREKLDLNFFQMAALPSTNFTQFDSRSIMLYPIPKELTLGGFEVPLNTELSENDRAFIAKLYPQTAADEAPDGSADGA